MYLTLRLTDFATCNRRGRSASTVADSSTTQDWRLNSALQFEIQNRPDPGIWTAHTRQNLRFLCRLPIMPVFSACQRLFDAIRSQPCNILRAQASVYVNAILWCPVIRPATGSRQTQRGMYMTGSSNDQIEKAASQAAAAAKQSEAAVQDQMWKRFDAMLQEFLRMEQTSPAAERQPARTGK
jgi:hypothetical protein